MTKNIGTTGRVVRVLAAIIIAALYFTDQITGLAATVLGIFAVVFLFTGSIGFCPLYVPIKFSTKKNAKVS